MKTMERKLEKEYEWLCKVMEEAKERLSVAPKGYLRITKKRKGVEYYYKDNTKSKKTKSNNGRYIRKAEYSLVVKLAQRDYDKDILKEAEERIKCIEEFLEKYKSTNLEQVYSMTNPVRKNLITPVVLSDEEYIKQWQSVPYQGKTFSDDDVEIITERGERVRSKSEKIIADKLFSLGIPYRYEYPLNLSDGVKVYPDFTILKLPEREEVYLEHFGRMDDMEYVDTVLYKLHSYEKSRIYLGVNLFVTYETSKNPLNTRTLDVVLKKLFCEE